MKAQLFAAILIACLCYASNLNNASDKTSEITLMQKEEDQSGNDKTAADTVGNQGSSIVEKNKNTPPQNIDWDKKIIRTANLSIEVKDYKTYSSNLNSLAKKFGGYIANEQETKNTERIENKAKIKVPVAQFQALMTAINSSGEKIIDQAGKFR